MSAEEPKYNFYHCIYSTKPCEECPFIQCKIDYHNGRLGLIARERRKLFRELRQKGWSVAMISHVCGQSNRWVRDKIRGVE